MERTSVNMEGSHPTATGVATRHTYVEEYGSHMAGTLLAEVAQGRVEIVNIQRLSM